MIVTAITCTYNRHKLLERVFGCFLNQDYSKVHTWLVYNNSSHSIDIDPNVIYPENKRIIIVNNSKDRETGNNYNDVGSIFRDALSFVPEETDICTFMDDDDFYLKNHISCGVKGMKNAYEIGKLAYKPYYSYFRYNGSQVSTEHNTMEPSIFVDFKYLKEKGFRKTTVDYHQEWIDSLIKENKLLIDMIGESTFLYDWCGTNGSFKISGGENNLENFKNHKIGSADIGDGIIKPIYENIL